MQSQIKKNKHILNNAFAVDPKKLNGNLKDKSKF